MSRDKTWYRVWWCWCAGGICAVIAGVPGRFGVPWTGLATIALLCVGLAITVAAARAIRRVLPVSWLHVSQPRPVAPRPEALDWFVAAMLCTLLTVLAIIYSEDAKQAGLMYIIISGLIYAWGLFILAIAVRRHVLSRNDGHTA